MSFFLISPLLKSFCPASAIDEIICLKLNIINYIIFKYSINDLIDTISKKVPKILLNNFLSIL